MMGWNWSKITEAWNKLNIGPRKEKQKPTVIMDDYISITQGISSIDFKDYWANEAKKRSNIGSPIGIKQAMPTGFATTMTIGGSGVIPSASTYYKVEPEFSLLENLVKVNTDEWQFENFNIKRTEHSFILNDKYVLPQSVVQVLNTLIIKK